MPQSSSPFPFTHRLPTDVASAIQATAAGDTPLVEMGSQRRRLAVLVLVLGLLGGGLAAGLPSGDPQAMRKECPNVVVVDIRGVPQTVEANNC
jgi:hypothetical protein